MSESGHSTTSLRKHIPRRPARIFGAYAIVFGALGFVFFAFVVQSWARGAATHHYTVYGEAYNKIYNLEVPIYGLMAVNSLIILLAGIGMILREKWSADAMWICGLIFVIGLWALFTAKNMLWYYDTALIAGSKDKTLGSIVLPYIVTLIVSLTMIVPAFIPAIRVSLHKKTKTTKRKLRKRNTRKATGRRN